MKLPKISRAPTIIVVLSFRILLPLLHTFVASFFFLSFSFKIESDIFVDRHLLCEICGKCQLLLLVSFSAAASGIFCAASEILSCQHDNFLPYSLQLCTNRLGKFNFWASWQYNLEISGEASTDSLFTKREKKCGTHENHRKMQFDVLRTSLREKSREHKTFRLPKCFSCCRFTAASLQLLWDRCWTRCHLDACGGGHMERVKGKKSGRNLFYEQEQF